MPEAHRHGDQRACGATTRVVGQTSVFVNGKLWAVKDDINTHLAGELIPTAGDTVFIEDKPVIVKGDLAKIDGQLHAGTQDKASAGSDDVIAYS